MATTKNSCKNSTKIPDFFGPFYFENVKTIAVATTTITTIKKPKTKKHQHQQQPQQLLCQ